MPEAHRNALIGSALAVALCALVTAAAQEPGPSQPQVPVASFHPPEPATPGELAIRHARGEHFASSVLLPIAEDDFGVTAISRHSRTVVFDDKALTDEADGIFRGAVEAATAFLTPGRETIYSEFRVRVDVVLKDNTHARVPRRLQVGDTVTALREGGAAQLPSGRIVGQVFNGQRLPEINGQYLLFVRRVPAAEAFVIITGYEVKDDEVTRLDEVFWFPSYEGPLAPFEQRLLSLVAASQP